MKIFIQEKEFENIVYKMVVIFCLGLIVLTTGF